jgi:type IV pilus assembly protein PilQ
MNFRRSPYIRFSSRPSRFSWPSWFLAALCVALTFGVNAPLAAGRARVDGATLKKIASRIDGRAGVVSIEASQPVPYVASQPDPRVFVIELRDTVAAGFADTFKPDPRHPFTAVEVEQGQAMDGTNVARVRMLLAQPMRPRVRSARNVILVEADRLDRRPMANSVPAGPPSAGPALRTTGLTPAQGPVVQLAAAQGQAAPPAAAPAVLQAPAPTPSATAAQGPAQAPAAPSRFTGFPISLDFQGADLRAVLRTFAEISGLNVVIDPTIQGTVDVALRDVPWDQALDIILRANRLGYAVDGTIVRIAPLTVLADEEAQRQKLAEAQALAGQLQTITRTLSYAKAEQVQPMLTSTILSQRGSITTDQRTNTLIITDLPDRLARAGELISTLDLPQPQVEIEARVVQTTRDFAQRLGVQWGLTGRADPALGNTLPLAFPNQATIGGRTGGTAGAVPAGEQRNQGPTTTDAASTVVNLGVSAATTGVGLALGAVNGALNLDAILSALESSGQGRVLSTPRVTTQNNIEASIEQGVQIPIQTVANNTVTVSFRSASLRLSVTPQITAANTVIMRIVVENAAPDFSRAINGIPPIDSQNANTQVLVSNGETTVIGGIYISREQSSQDRTPGLYRIPLLGWLFQRNQVTDESRELLIFITPRIVRL